MSAENDNRPAPARVVPIVGFVCDEVVTITHPELMPEPQPSDDPA